MTKLTITTPPTLRFPAVNPIHPAGIAAHVQQVREAAKKAFPTPLAGAKGKTALVLGSTSLGYGCPTTVALKEAGFEKIVGLGFAPSPILKDDAVKRAAPDWYVTGALHELYPGKVRTYLADAFVDDTRERLIDDLVRSGTKIDFVLYSVAAPGRDYLGKKWKSAINVLGDPLQIQNLAVNLKTREAELKPATLESATDVQTEGTRRVMGGEDIALWVAQLLYNGLLAEGCSVASLSYIGPEFGPLRRVYWDGTLGAAKKDIDFTMQVVDGILKQRINGKALSVMAPAIVSRASAVIPGVMTYVNLYLGAASRGVGRYMDPVDVGIELTRALYSEGAPYQKLLDEEGRLRLDGAELSADVQKVVQDGWAQAQTGQTSDLLREGAKVFCQKYLAQYGWEIPGVDYTAPTEFDVKLDEAMGVIDLIENPPAAAAVAGTARVDAYFGGMFARKDGGVRQERGTLALTAATSQAQSALLARITGNDKPHAAGVMAASMDFAESIALVFNDIRSELEAQARKSVIHAQEVIYILDRVPLTDPRERRLKRRAMKAGVFMTNRAAFDASGKMISAGDTSLAIGADLSQAAPDRALDIPALGECVGKEPLISRMIDWFVQASGDDNIVHTSRRGAMEVGLPNRVAHGMLVFALADKWLHTARPGLDIARPRKITTKFAGFVLPEDELAFYVNDSPRGIKVSVLKAREGQTPSLVLEMTVNDLGPDEVAKVREQKQKQVELDA